MTSETTIPTTGEQNQDDWTCSKCGAPLEPDTDAHNGRYCPGCRGRKVRDILDKSPVDDDGDWVWYDGHEWRAHHLHGTNMLLRRLDPDDATQNIEEWGVGVRKLIPIDATNCSDCGASLPGRVDVDMNGTHVLLSSQAGRADVWCPECCAEIEHDYVSYALARSVVY